MIRLDHRIRIHRRATRVGAFEVFEAAHVALRTLLAFSQPVNCIFWPIGMLNWLVAASKLHKHRVTCCTAEWPFYVFLFYGLDELGQEKIVRLIIRLCINAGKQTDHPSRRTICVVRLFRRICWHSSSWRMIRLFARVYTPTSYQTNYLFT